MLKSCEVFMILAGCGVEFRAQNSGVLSDQGNQLTQQYEKNLLAQDAAHEPNGSVLSCSPVGRFSRFPGEHLRLRRLSRGQRQHTKIVLLGRLLERHLGTNPSVGFLACSLLYYQTSVARACTHTL